MSRYVVASTSFLDGLVTVLSGFSSPMLLIDNVTDCNHTDADCSEKVEARSIIIDCLR